MISIAPATFWPMEAIKARYFLEADGRVERAIRTDITLDNEVVVTDSGFSWARTTQRVSIDYFEEKYDTLINWLQGWPEVVISRPEGAWHCALKDVIHQQKVGRIVITLLIIDRVDTA